MSIRKKVLFAALLVAMLTMSVAGTASARGWGGRGRGGFGGGWGGGYGYGDCCGGMFYGGGPYGGRGYGPRDGRGYVYEAPQEIREKLAEAQKVAIDLRLEFDKQPINRGKVSELREKHRAIMQEVSDWRFNNRLDFYDRQFNKR